MNMKWKQSGFTLVEIAIVLLIVTILLGYTVALFPKQQQLKQYRALNLKMDRVMEAIIGFAQVNGRLPCPALPNGTGNENNNANGCGVYGGFVPANTLGLDGRLNEDGLLIDPWGNPYRYYVTFNSDLSSNFTAPGEMRAVGLVDSEPDGYIDLDGRYLICDAQSSVNNNCDSANQVFGDFQDGGGFSADRYAGAPFVLLSMGGNWSDAAPLGDELENSGAFEVTGTSGNKYRLKSVEDDVPTSKIGETTFVKRPTGFADDFDDVVRWVSPSVLYSRMIQAGQLP